MATKYLAKTFSYGVLLQTNWASPQAANANFRTIAYNSASVNFDPDIRPELFNTSGQNGIHKEFERVLVDGRSGLSRMSFSMPADVPTIEPHLTGAMQAVSETQSGSFEKTITAGGLTGVIDFNGDGGFVYTIAMENKASSDDGIVLQNAIIENLEVSWDFLANGVGRLAQISGNWVGIAMNFEQTTNGSWSTTTFAPMGDTDDFSISTFTVDGVAFTSMNVRKFTFNVANNVTTNAATTAGKPNNYDIAPVYTSKILLDYNSVTEKVLKDFQDGATVVAKIDSSISSATTGDFSISCVNGILQRQPFEYNGDFAAIVLDVMWHSNSAATPVTILITDNINRHIP